MYFMTNSIEPLLLLLNRFRSRRLYFRDCICRLQWRFKALRSGFRDLVIKYIIEDSTWFLFSTWFYKSFSCMTPETWAGSVSVSTWMAESTLLTLPIFPTVIFYFFVTYVNFIVFFYVLTYVNSCLLLHFNYV